MVRFESTVSATRTALLDALALVSPVRCSGCGVADRAVCDDCAAALRPCPRQIDMSGLAVTSALTYAGVVRQVIASFKDAGRTDAGTVLAAALRTSVVHALAASHSEPGSVRLASIPSTPAARRARGYAPVAVLLRRAGLRAEPVLCAVRATRDQAELGARARRENRDRWLAARPGARAGRFLLVDDILTTGSTLLEARRALLEAGAQVIGAAVLARTPLRLEGRASDGFADDE
jgi:predicted amidophosphoribosyltransferase